MHNITYKPQERSDALDLCCLRIVNFFREFRFVFSAFFCKSVLPIGWADRGGVAFQKKGVSCTRRRSMVLLQRARNGCGRKRQLLFICYGNQCLPGDESAADTPLLISQFLPCSPQTGDGEPPELLSVKSSTVTTDHPIHPRQFPSSEVGLCDATSMNNACITYYVNCF